MEPRTPRKANRQRPTMRDVAALAGVGTKTVSRVVNGELSVSEQTARRVMDAVEQLNYQPDLNAGNLKRGDGRTNTIGLLVGAVDNPFAGAIHRAVELEARKRDMIVFTASVDNDPEREEAVVRSFLRRRVDGLILTTATRDQRYLLPEVARGTPIVFVDREPSGIVADAVVSENRHGAAVATQHLLDRGHRRIAYIGDRPELQTARERHLGFLDAMGRAGLNPDDPFLRIGFCDENSAQSAAGRVLDAPDRPTAIFAGKNLTTIGVVRALYERGLQHEIALVGFDDFSLADLLSPGVTVMAQDPAAIGRLAAQRLLAQLDGDETESRTSRLPTRLIQRGSGEIPPAS